MNRGFTLIEVLIFATIMAVFFVVAAAVITLSIRQMSAAEHKIIATRHAEALSEWLKGEKEADWNNFLSKVGNYLPKSTVCFNNFSWPAQSGICLAGDYLERLYKRQAKFSYSPDAVTVEVTVSWREG